MERVRRLAGDGIPERRVLNAPPLTADQARSWGRYAGASPLYQRLIEVIASDPDLLGVLNAMESSPRPNVMLAGVQLLLMKGDEEDLARFYPNLATSARDPDDIAAPFRQFVLEHRSELVEIGRHRRTQTNECRRCVALLPAIWALPVDRFHLVDLGTSAGLNLQMLRYHYRWGDTEWGPDSKVRLSTENRGRPVTPRPVTNVTRTGLDLQPLDATDPEDRLWLEALVWPEQHDRRQRLQAALALAAADPPRLVAGDAIETLADVVAALPAADPVVVVNSFVLNQLPPERRDLLADVFTDLRQSRAVYRVSMEWLTADEDAASVEIDSGSGWERIGMASPHADWIELYARP